MAIKYSIIVPVYNVVNVLDECLNSIFTQSYPDFELILIDDASNDGSTNLLMVAEEKSNVKVIYLNESLGPGNARNIGARVAVGEYILFVDSDDKISPELLACLSEFSSELIIFNFLRFWLNSKQIINPNSKILSDLKGKNITNIEDRELLFSNFQVCWNKAYKREFYLREMLSFKEGYYEDISFNYQALLKSRTIVTTSFVGYYYRQRTGSILNSSSDKHSDIISQYSTVYDDVINIKNKKILMTINDIFIGHTFNIIIKQRKRLTDNAFMNIIDGFSVLNNKYLIFNNSGITSKVKCMLLLLIKLKLSFRNH
ncbi:hypothetical protein A9264_15260 [Vibrio sp. UCD-FRSSP16_10]|uniref:glycosyltransferase family 2 protein n=1 Tax=unclassified Vibrio TaxID=2614977 RepID=UPI0007FFCCA5|nr:MULTISPECIES: glycosyltransferase family 2 protein [unclassified Vibrio]OBT13662.1 hypothetical protein A9260_13925 [Vibrio sp. UCD-FRSSP16_30]OBT19216.1 hypothetical protein A9264_15260 [Vibrio sp. UCD-FRSSP16_10]